MSKTVPFWQKKSQNETIVNFVLKSDLRFVSACYLNVEYSKDAAAAIKFDQQVEVLKIADKCLDEEILIYTKGNVWFYELGRREDSLEKNNRYTF